MVLSRYLIWTTSLTSTAYTVEIGMGLTYSEFNNKDFPRLYELLSLLIETEITNKDEAIETINELEGKLSMVEIKKLVKKLEEVPGLT